MQLNRSVKQEVCCQHSRIQEPSCWAQCVSLCLRLSDCPLPSILSFCLPAPRRFYKHWYTSKKKAFTRYAKKFAEAPQEIDAELARIKQYAQVVRVIAHTQVN